MGGIGLLEKTTDRMQRRRKSCIPVNGSRGGVVSGREPCLIVISENLFRNGEVWVRNEKKVHRPTHIRLAFDLSELRKGNPFTPSRQFRERACVERSTQAMGGSGIL